MGVKLHITQEDLPKEFKQYQLIKSTDGISQTVYFLDNLYVVKIFHHNNISSLQNEINLLNSLEDLKVSKPINKIFYIKKYPSLIYPKAKGKSLTISTKESLEQIGKFLSKLHSKTKNRNISNIKLYETERLYKLIIKTKNQEFLDNFNNIDIDLKHDGIIHGDLFMDNCTFDNGHLEIVYDFCEACVGDFIFDLAVVAISWCKNDEDIQILLEAYGYSSTIEHFAKYCNYAQLYYNTTRFLNNTEYVKYN